MGLFGWLKKAPEIKKAEFVSPATGKIIPVDQVEDETFASKILGDGFAVELTDGEVIAPFDGEVTAAFPTGHAYGLKREDGLECLIHIGLDTVELNGSGFDVKVKQGDQVKQGQVLGITGSTGNSTGAHLHFEITEGGVRVNPLNYLTGYIKAW